MVSEHAKQAMNTFLVPKIINVNTQYNEHYIQILTLFFGKSFQLANSTSSALLHFDHLDYHCLKINTYKWRGIIICNKCMAMSSHLYIYKTAWSVITIHGKTFDGETMYFHGWKHFAFA